MKVEVDQAALAGAAAAGVIAISASEGAYEPFESVIGAVLLLLLVTYYRPAPVLEGENAWRKSIPAAAAGGLVLSLIAAYPVQVVLTRDLFKESRCTSLCLCLVWLLSSTLLTFLVRRKLRPTDSPAPPNRTTL